MEATELVYQPITPEALTSAIRRYLDGEATADALRAYLAACDAAIVAGTAGRELSRPVGRAALVLLEQDEGVRPPADVRSTLAAIVRALAGEPAPLSRRQRTRAARQARARTRSAPAARRRPRRRPPRA